MSKINFNDFQLKYKFDCQLSQGSFGRVCRIQERSTKKQYALKKVTVKNPTQLHDIQSQIHILQQYKHPYIVEIIQTYKIQIKNGFSKSTCQIGIVMELAKYSLQHLIRIKKGINNVEFVIHEIVGIVGVLARLQKDGIAHRDIKPANILVFQEPEGEGRMRWKLADFGLALDLNKNVGKQENNNFAGSFQYASPILRKKFRYPHLKIKNNPFKDDVYSLGVTLLEVITGSRNYNNGGYDKLREVCEDPRLINLIDVMLQEQQDKRPCFKQLMAIIEKQFISNMPQHSFELSSNPTLYSKKSFQKKESVYMQPPVQILQKTVIKNSETDQKINPRVQIYNVQKAIQCIVSLDGIAMCGCEHGSLIFVKNGKIVQAGIIHERYVSELFDDGKGYIWSIGGDNTIKKYHKTSLIKSLLSETQQIQIPTIPDIFSSSPPTSTMCLQLKLTNHECIVLPNPQNHKHGCSTIYAQDNQHYIVGYYDGFVYIKWGQCQYQGKMFYKPVTDIKMGRNREKVYFCGMGGEVKGFLVNKGWMDNRIFWKQRVPFLSIHTTIEQPNSLTVLSQNGTQYILSQSLQCQYESTISSPNPQPYSNLTIMASMQCQYKTPNNTNNNYYVLTLNGQILDCNQEKVAELGSKGWSCFTMSAEREIVVAGLHGKLAVVQW